MLTLTCPACGKLETVDHPCHCLKGDTDSPRLLPGDLTDAMAGYPVTKVKNVF